MLDRLSASVDPTPDLFCLRGVVSDALGLGDLAEKYYRKALYLDPSHRESLAHLALFLELNGRTEAAGRLRRRAGRGATP
jgi:chemotaxis protein methyltransferase WspC